MEHKETKTTVEQKTVTGHTPLAGPDTATTELKIKKKYSKGTQGAQKLGQGLNKATADVASAVSIAMSSYRDRAERSSTAKKDGMLRDAVENLTKAASKGMKKAADAPYDMVKTVTRGKNSKQIRNVAKMFSPPMFR